MSREKNKDLRILVLIGVLASILIWNFLWYETDKLIQSQLIIVLIVTTIYYAMQTYKLVEQEKRKSQGDWSEKKLIDFFWPLGHKLIKMKHAIEEITGLNKLDNRIESVIDILNEITELYSKYGYMTIKEMKTFFEDLKKTLSIILDIRHGEEKEFLELRKKMISIIEKISNRIIKQTRDHIKKINEAYKVNLLNK